MADQHSNSDDTQSGDILDRLRALIQDSMESMRDPIAMLLLAGDEIKALRSGVSSLRSNLEQERQLKINYYDEIRVLEEKNRELSSRLDAISKVRDDVVADYAEGGHMDLVTELDKLLTDRSGLPVCANCMQKAQDVLALKGEIEAIRLMVERMAVVSAGYGAGYETDATYMQADEALLDHFGFTEKWFDENRDRLRVARETGRGIKLKHDENRCPHGFVGHCAACQDVEDHVNGVGVYAK